MALITVKQITDKGVWESFLATHSEANFLQSWYWGEFHVAYGNVIYHTGFYEGDTLVGVMLSIVENARRGRYLTVPGGPILDWTSAEQVSAFVAEIKRLAQLEKCLFVRVRPQLESNDFSKELFAAQGFLSAPTHLHAELTCQLDITKPEEALLAQMRKATRYEVKKALTLGIQVTMTPDPAAIKAFYEIQLLTSQRQKFVPFSYKFLHEQFKVFAEAGKALLLSAEYEGKTLAQAVVIFYGEEAAYHYGASTEDGRKYPGAYLVQWEAIKEAQKRGMKRYNFWGVSPESQKDHRFAGLSTFKRGFGGQEFEYLHARDLVIQSWRYHLVAFLEKIRAKLRRV